MSSRSIVKTYAKPIVIIGAVAIVSLVICVLSGRFQPTYEADSVTYLEFDFTAPLSQIRTIGYPSFLRAFGSAGAAPLGHWIAISMAAAVFCCGMIYAGYRRGIAVIAASVLLFGRGLLEWGSVIAADSLAIALAVAATGCFLACTRARAHRGWWVALCILTAITYQTRPAYLFLIPLWPVASFLADWLLLRRTRPKTEWLRRAAVFGLVTCLPFVAFCTMRWVTVGHFGIVSFGGYNIVGVASQFLDDEVASDLPERLQPLASEILSRRERFPEYQTPSSFDAMEQNFNIAVWQIAVPAAAKLCDDDQAAINELLSATSREILIRRKGLYVKWLVWNANHARQEIFRVTIFDRGSTLLFVVVLVLYGYRLWTGPATDTASRLNNEALQQRHVELHLVPWIAMGFTVAKTMLVMLVEPANARYMSGAACLLPVSLVIITVILAEGKDPTIWQYKTNDARHE